MSNETALDYQMLKKSKQDRASPSSSNQHKMRTAFVECTSCGYFWTRRILESDNAECRCPKCGEISKEVL